MHSNLCHLFYGSGHEDYIRVHLVSIPRVGEKLCLPSQLLPEWVETDVYTVAGITYRYIPLPANPSDVLLAYVSIELEAVTE